MKNPHLPVKYADGNGNLEDDRGFRTGSSDMWMMPELPGYNDKWKETVVIDHGEIIKIPE